VTTDIKSCVICKAPKPFTEFNRKRRSQDGLQPHCRECNREASRAYYRRNRAQHLVDVGLNLPKYRVRNRELVFAHLLENPCVDCGETDPLVLDLDHVRGIKAGDVSRLSAFPVGPVRLRAEIDKCEVRCVNCHRRRSRRTLGWWRDDRTASGPAGGGPVVSA
jgi:hypothetical protein